MPLKVMDVVEQRLAVLQEPAWSGRSVMEVCRRHGISRDTYYAWKRRYEADGLAGLVPQDRRPVSSPGQLMPEVEDRILALRKEHGWGPRKIRDALNRESSGSDPAAVLTGFVVPAISTIQQALARRGVLTPRRRRPPRRSEGQRFNRSASNELWQIDGAQRHLADGSPYWVVDLVDDHSRFCPGTLVGAALTGQLAWSAVRGAVEQYGLPAELLSDNGLCFTGRLHGVIVSFERQVVQAGIRFAHSRPFHPQTCGKVERLHGTISDYLIHHHPVARSLAEAQEHHNAFRVHYNTIRPHQSLDGAVPADLYRPGSGQLLPVIELPPADHNPPGCVRRRVSSGGVFSYAHQKYSLGMRWAGVTVGLLREAARLHVFYGQSLIETVLVDPELATPTR